MGTQGWPLLMELGHNSWLEMSRHMDRSESSQTADLHAGQQDQDASSIVLPHIRCTGLIDTVGPVPCPVYSGFLNNEISLECMSSISTEEKS